MKKDILEQLGLSVNEVLIYNTLLSEGELQPPYIAKKTGLTRTNTYALLKSLAKKGLIEEFKKKNKLHYRLEPPQKLKEYIESQKKNLEQSEKTLEAVLPSLTSEYNLTSNKPGIVYFEGTEGIKKIFKLLYSSKSEPILGCVDLEKLNKSFPNLADLIIIPTRKRNKVETVTFFAKSTEAETKTKKDKEELRKSALLDKKEYPIPAEIDVFEDKIAMLDFSKGKFTGIIIENKDMATSLKTIMKLAFESKNIKT